MFERFANTKGRRKIMKPMRRDRQRMDVWSPFDQLNRLRDQINRLFESPVGTGFGSGDGWGPALDIFEDKDKFTVKAELPGMKREDIQVAMHGTTLSISGERQTEAETKQGECYQSERYYGRFQRHIELPQAVDAGKVSATYKDGVLTITCAKTEESKRRQIEIKSGESTPSSTPGASNPTI
jgi:HSP20 family protein